MRAGTILAKASASSSPWPEREHAFARVTHSSNDPIPRLLRKSNLIVMDESTASVRDPLIYLLLLFHSQLGKQVDFDTDAK